MRFRGNKFLLFVFVFSLIFVNGLLLINAEKDQINNDNEYSMDIYVYYESYLAINSTEIMRKGSTINWLFIGSNPNVDINVYAMTFEEFQKFEENPSNGQKEVLSYGQYMASGTFIVPSKALWVVVFYNVDDNMIGTELNVDVEFIFKPLNYWIYVGPSIATGVILITLGIFFYVRYRKSKGLPVIPKREKKVKVKEAKEPKPIKVIYRPSLVHFFRIISIFPTYTVTNYCIMFCCCTLANILFFLTVGLVVFPFWLFFRFFTFVKFDSEKIILRNIFDERTVSYDEIVDINVQGRYSQRITSKSKSFGSTSTSSGPVNPHSISLIIKTKAPAYVTMDLKKYTYDQGVNILNYLTMKIKEKQVDFNIQNSIHIDSAGSQEYSSSQLKMDK